MNFTGSYCRRDFVRFLVPLMAAELFQQIYGLINTAVVSRALDYRALAVIGACSGLMSIRAHLLSGMLYGFGIYLGAAVGSGDPGQLARTFSASLEYTLLFSLLGLTAAFSTSGLIQIGNIPPQLQAGAASYLAAAFAGTGATAAKLLLIVLLQAVGDTGYFSLMAVLGVLTNTALILVLIRVLKGGLACAALAGPVTDLLLALLLLGYIRRRYPGLLKTLPRREIPGAVRLRLLQHGGTKASYFFLSALGSLILQRSINLLPAVQIAGQTLATVLQTILLAPLGELGTASGVITGQNVGAGCYDNILLYHRRLSHLMLILGLGLTFAVFFAGQPLLGLIAGAGVPREVVRAALSWLRITALAFPVNFAILHRNSLQAMGCHRSVIALGAAGLPVNMMAARLLVPTFKISGGALGVALGWMAQTALGVLLFHQAVKGGLKHAD